MSQTVWLQRPNSDVPWGFRLAGGVENQEPIKVQRVTVGSVASKNLNNGDVIVRIGNTDTTSKSLAQCNELIKEAGNLLQLMVCKSNGPMSPPQTAGNQQGFPTKLNEQLASIDMNDYSRQQSSGSQGSGTSPYFSPTSPPGAPGYHPLANAQAPRSPYSGGSSPALSPGRSGQKKVPPKVAEKPKVPDAVVNMAARGDPDKKPFTYAADMDEIKEHRERVRRKPQGIPSYQNILNLPQFDDRPKPRYTKPKSLVPEEPPAGPPIAAGPGEGTFVHAQYNSPLQMYSNEAMDEAFKGQTGGVITAAQKPGPAKPSQDITQSETYKMIHGLDDKPKPRTYGSPSRAARTSPQRRPPTEDDRKWTGLNRSDEIPSKAFHRLQSWTDQEHEEAADNVPEIDTSSIRRKDDEDEVGGYAEASIRYMGKNIPSRSFRMLQNMTGGEDQPVSTPAAHRQRQARRREEQRQAAIQPPPASDEIVDISYVGGNIPSRSFKMLQNMTGENESTDGKAPASLGIVPSEKPSDDLGSPGGPPVPAPREDQSVDRRQRRRERNQQMKMTQDQDTNKDKQESNASNAQPFDEQAYLSGQVQIVSGSVNHPHSRRAPRRIVSSSQPEPEEEQPVGIPNFDEKAYLAGKISVFGGETRPIEKDEKKREKAPWEREEDFDAKRAEIFQDDKFIVKDNVDNGSNVPWAERQSLVDSSTYGEPTTATDSNAWELYKGPDLKKPQAYRERAPWERPVDDTAEGEESAYTDGNIPVLAARRHSKGKYNKIPSKAFSRLCRSMSRETSPLSDLPTSGYTSADETEEGGNLIEGDPDSAYKDFVYVGRKIPSRTFLRLRQSMDKKSEESDAPPTPDEFQKMSKQTGRNNQKTSKRVEEVLIEDQKPEEYLAKLKKEMEESGIKIEASPEATDF